LAGAAIFTDLDRTLLSSAYECREALGELEALSALGVPVVPVSSRTFGEIAAYAEELPIAKLGGSFVAVAEVGGAVYVSRKAALGSGEGVVEVPVAARLASVKRAIKESLAEASCKEKPLVFTESDPEEVAEATGLPKRQALLATRREYDEVILFGDTLCKRKFVRSALRRGLDVIEGTKMVHVGLGIGKDRGFRKLLELAPQLRGLVKVCLGDSKMDEAFLRMCDLAVVVPWEGPRYKASPPLASKSYLVSPYPAPRGWVWAVRKALVLAKRWKRA